jgi:hypothetical protein
MCGIPISFGIIFVICRVNLLNFALMFGQNNCLAMITDVLMYNF